MIRASSRRAQTVPGARCGSRRSERLVLCKPWKLTAFGHSGVSFVDAEPFIAGFPTFAMTANAQERHLAKKIFKKVFSRSSSLKILVTARMRGDPTQSQLYVRASFDLFVIVKPNNSVNTKKMQPMAFGNFARLVERGVSRVAPKMPKTRAGELSRAVGCCTTQHCKDDRHHLGCMKSQ